MNINGTFYRFDSGDPDFYGRRFTAEELRGKLRNPQATERDFVRLAVDMETELIRYTIRSGKQLEGSTLYDPSRWEGRTS